MDAIIKSLKENGAAIAIVLAAALKFGFIGPGRETPDFLKPSAE